MSDVLGNTEIINEIKLFIKYAVPEQDLVAATALVEKYERNKKVLALLREYYFSLPEALEEPVIRVTQLLRRQGVSLFVLTTPSTAHLYTQFLDEVVWIGEYLTGLEIETLNDLGFQNNESFLKICPPIASLKVYEDKKSSRKSDCPACGIQEGEFHILGCSVEICPWCDGQLSKCNCRFEQLETDVIDNEEQLEELYDLLSTKGRIPFVRQHAPYYPSAGDDTMDEDSEK